MIIARWKIKEAGLLRTSCRYCYTKWQSSTFYTKWQSSTFWWEVAWRNTPYQEFSKFLRRAAGITWQGASSQLIWKISFRRLEELGTASALGWMAEIVSFWCFGSFSDNLFPKEGPFIKVILRTLKGRGHGFEMLIKTMFSPLINMYTLLCIIVGV